MIGDAPMSIATPLSDDQPWTKDQIIGRLDEANRHYIESRYARVQWMVFAKDRGLSFHEIGVAVGITEQAARKAVNKAVG